MDNMTKIQRSLTMSRIRSIETKPEQKLRSYLHKAGYRFRKNVIDLPGKPDIVLAKYKTVIFVHGCFWHQHDNCPFAVKPKSNIDYWDKKLINNVVRDQANIGSLELDGWRVIVVWECEINRDIELVFPRIVSELLSD